MLLNSHDSGYVWSVNEVTAYIREIFDIDYRLQDIQVTGELSNFVRARSGHLYFTLKDDKAQLKCVMWRSLAERLQFQPQDGDAVVARGRISVYEVGGVYQLYADSLVPTGRGDLALAFERLKQALEAEGLFDTQEKKPVPEFPNRIGIVTSADAAALRDIIHVLNRRWPLVSVLVAPTLVQGKDAPPQIVKALQWLDGRNDIDTIILARGGGSIEDLWAFNEEIVARAIFAARHPIITGIGHETDFTIADFVADVRAATPSVAAEIAVPDRREIMDHVHNLQSSLLGITEKAVSNRRERLGSLTRTMRHLSPRASLDSGRQRVDWLVVSLERNFSQQMENVAARLAVAEARLKAISPFATLDRGYAIVRGPDKRIVKSVNDVGAGDSLHIQVSDGEFDATVNSGA